MRRSFAASVVGWGFSCQVEYFHWARTCLRFDVAAPDYFWKVKPPFLCVACRRVRMSGRGKSTVPTVRNRNYFDWFLILKNK